MRNGTECLRNGAETRCAICDGQFGLVRHYTWRTALCSKKCLYLFKGRQESDRRWLPASSRPTTVLAVGISNWWRSSAILDDKCIPSLNHRRE
jgi:hypothetical protein